MVNLQRPRIGITCCARADNLRKPTNFPGQVGKGPTLLLPIYDPGSEILQVVHSSFDVIRWKDFPSNQEEI